ncbi:MAG: hypothetical protein LAT82_04590 [Nanoarchaeota archaeon]|nr:hypothetical protein [Nanoarchaeota archaeon]
MKLYSNLNLSYNSNYNSILLKIILLLCITLFTIQYSSASSLLYTPTCELRGEIIEIEQKEEFIDNCTIDGSCPVGAFVDYLPPRYEITINISSIKTLDSSESDCLMVFRRNTPFTMNLPLEKVDNVQLLKQQNILTANVTYSLTNEIISYIVLDPSTIPLPPEKPKTIFGLFWEWLKGLF